MTPGDEKDLTSEYDATEKPVQRIVIRFNAVDTTKKITLIDVPELKVCSHPSKCCMKTIRQKHKPGEVKNLSSFIVSQESYHHICSSLSS